MQNALKHAAPSVIDIRLSRRDDALVLAVEDNGSGRIEDFNKNGRGVGRPSMEHRARLIGGALDLRQRPGGGIALVCTVQAPAAS